ncbi:hypothetical protein GGER_15280 [Serratia rubidaea]
MLSRTAAGGAGHLVYAGALSARQIAAVRFGDEGQYWRMMAIEEFIHHPQGIAHLRQRLATLLAARTR